MSEEQIDEAAVRGVMRRYGLEPHEGKVLAFLDEAMSHAKINMIRNMPSRSAAPTQVGAA